MSSCFTAAVSLHEYLVKTHWKTGVFSGPDPGVRWNYRIGRFVKSGLRKFPWRDDLCYLQGQAYWVLGNWNLLLHTGDQEFRDIAIRASQTIVRRQRPDGAWDHPNPEWKGRVATVEGIWGALGLLESYRQTVDEQFLGGALKWHDFVIKRIGFQDLGGGLAINYFADNESGRVPNNSTDALRLFAELVASTADEKYAEHCDGMLSFLLHAQLPSGEFPYVVDGDQPGSGRTHFQCYQYNAYECLGLMEYANLTHDERALPAIRNVLRFLRDGIGADGRAFYACGNPYRYVLYHTAALALAFQRAATMGIEGYEELADRAWSCVLRHQRSDGNFSIYSTGDYRLLTDRRSYPRCLAMIMHHLLSADVSFPKAVLQGEQESKVY